MKFQKSINIWAISDKEIATLQPGQWVYGGEPRNQGRFLGVKKSGTVVVAWYGNANQQPSYMGYIKMLLNYAKSN